MIKEWFEVHWSKDSFAACRKEDDSKEAWNRFVMELGNYPLYHVWFVTKREVTK